MSEVRGLVEYPISSQTTQLFPGLSNGMTLYLTGDSARIWVGTTAGVKKGIGLPMNPLASISWDVGKPMYAATEGPGLTATLVGLDLQATVNDPTLLASLISGGTVDATAIATAIAASGLTSAAIAAAIAASGLTPVNIGAAIAGFDLSVVGPLTNAQLRAAGVPVIGPLTDAQLRAAAIPQNLAQVGGNAVSAIVPGTQDVSANKRSGATGLSPQYAANRITTNATTNVTNATARLSSLLIACSAAGTAWTLKIQTKEATPKIIVPTFTLSVPTTGLPPILNFTEPILCTSGIDIVTAGTTAGTLDVFATYWQ